MIDKESKMLSSTYVPSTHLSNLNIYYLLTIYVSIYLSICLSTIKLSVYLSTI